MNNLRILWNVDFESRTGDLYSPENQVTVN